MRVLCIGDSLGLPRDGCKYEDTWFYKLKANYPQYEFVDYFTRSLLIPKALEMFDLYYRFYNPDIVILQIGVCDCSPRYINDKKIIWRFLKKISTFIGCEFLFWKIVKIRGRSESCVYTKLDEFTQGFETLIEKFVQEESVKKIYIILIGKCTDSILRRNKYFNKNVEKYNNTIFLISERHRDVVTVLNPLGEPSDVFFTDGYHCNSKGMTIVYKIIKKYMDEFLKNV